MFGLSYTSNKEKAEQEARKAEKKHREKKLLRESEKKNADEREKELLEKIDSLTTRPEEFRDVNETSLEERKRKLMVTKAYARRVPYVNILLLGLVGHGKTSFVNTVYSTLIGNVLALCPVGISEKSLTKKFRMHRFRRRNEGDTEDLAFFRLCDTMGVEGGDGITENDLSAIMDGHIRDKYTFNPLQPIDANSERYLLHPMLEDKMHCVGICVHAAKLSLLNSEAGQMKKLRRIANEAYSKGLSCVIILTNIDAICPIIHGDPSKTFHSAKLEEAVRETANLFGVPANQVFPVKNYEKEIHCSPAISNMAILACQMMIDYANAYLENEVDASDEDND